MTRSGAKPLLDVMKDLSILRLVDMRGNTDETLLGILENGEHYTTFSTFQVNPHNSCFFPLLIFWMLRGFSMVCRQRAVQVH